MTEANEMIKTLKVKILRNTYPVSACFLWRQKSQIIIVLDWRQIFTCISLKTITVFHSNIGIDFDRNLSCLSNIMDGTCLQVFSAWPIVERIFSYIPWYKAYVLRNVSYETRLYCKFYITEIDYDRTYGLSGTHITLSAFIHVNI